LMEDNVLWGWALKAGLIFSNIPEYLLKFRIDQNFYKRRSGIKYGWKYVQRKSELNCILDSPFYNFPLLFGKGLLMMFPSFIFKYVYIISRRFS
jgi:hypothetical protein